jgi:hypothetical protein
MKSIATYKKIWYHKTHATALSSYLSFLAETICNFLGCKAEILYDPLSELAELYDIKIMENPKRGYYPLDDRTAILLIRGISDKTFFTSVAIKIWALDVKGTTKLLSILEYELSNIFSNEFHNHFSNCLHKFGDELLKTVISEYVAKVGPSPKIVRHLLEYFAKLRTTSFEGKYFSTGAIISKSSDKFDTTFKGTRFGQSRKLVKPISLKRTTKIDKRIWYLVDGKTSFLVGSRELMFRNLFTIDEHYAQDNYLDMHSLSLTLKGGDFLVKVENEKLLSIITSDGSEFLYFENKWKYRNYSVLKELLYKYTYAHDGLINSLLFYILTCSKRQMSTILWLPNQMNEIDPFINVNTKNSLLKDKLNIMDKSAVNHLFRCFSSDGVSIIDGEGTLVYMGVIVDISKADVKGIAGTGESAASVLSGNGIAIKISSDGLIKIFAQGNVEPYHF